MGRPGKIERLPKCLRDELGERYLNGASFGEIAAWINAEPEAIKRWELHFPDNAKLEDHNLSAWKRDGGFARWKETWAVGNLAERCFRIAQAAGGNITRGAAAILGGQILAGVEALADGTAELAEDDDREKPDRADQLVKLSMALKMTAEAGAIPDRTDIAQGKFQLDKEKHGLDLKKFQRTTCELFLKFYKDKKAKEIAGGSMDQDRKLDLLAKHFWGEMPEGVGPLLPLQTST